jgi:hypothetical protein
MTDDILERLPKVGELTLPMWQDWLSQYDVILKKQEHRIRKLENALHAIADTPIGKEVPDRTTTWGLAFHMQQTAKDALKEGKDEPRR